MNIFMLIGQMLLYMHVFQSSITPSVA